MSEKSDADSKTLEAGAKRQAESEAEKDVKKKTKLEAADVKEEASDDDIKEIPPEPPLVKLPPAQDSKDDLLGLPVEPAGKIIIGVIES